MKQAVAFLLMGIVAATQAQAVSGQWKWRDANGAVQYSDRPPPSGTPEHLILSRPAGVRKALPVTPVAAEDVASSPEAAAAPAANKGGDPELEARRKKAEEEKLALRKAEEAKQAKLKADNCERARAYQRTLNDGVRIARTNAKGEREILNDQDRAEEMRRTQEAVQANCF